MERIPEPELMDGEAQARAYAEADFEEPHSRFIALLRASFPDLPVTGAALDLGCGPADITLRVARAYPRWTVDGVDASAAMLAHGRAAVERAGLRDRITLVECYLPDGDAPRPSYGLVLSNSLLHHLRDPLVLWQSVRRWTRDGGAVFVMDLMRPASRDDAQRLVDCYAAGEPDVLRHDFFHSLLAAYRPEEVAAQLGAAGLGHLELRVVSDRHLVVCGRL
jgi:SAM-dependent methyltransferase